MSLYHHRPFFVCKLPSMNPNAFIKLICLIMPFNWSFKPKFCFPKWTKPNQSFLFFVCVFVGSANLVYYYLLIIRTKTNKFYNFIILKNFRVLCFCMDNHGNKAKSTEQTLTKLHVFEYYYEEYQYLRRSVAFFLAFFDLPSFRFLICSYYFWKSDLNSMLSDSSVFLTLLISSSIVYSFVSLNLLFFISWNVGVSFFAEL